MASSGSDGAGRDAAGELDSLSNPQLASLSAVDLVVHLYNNHRSGSSFADVALVLATRERSAADAEAQIRADAVRGLESDARIRRADETEERLRAEIRALKRRADEAEARARLGSSDIGGRHSAAAGEDDRAVVALEVGEIEPELGAQEAVEDDVEPDDTLTLSQYLKKQKLLREAEAEAESQLESYTRGYDAWGNVSSLAIVSSHDEALAAVPLEVILPGNDDLSPNHGLIDWERMETDHVGGTGDDDEPQNCSDQDLPSAVVASPVLASMGSSEADGVEDSISDTESSPVAMDSAGGVTLEASNTTVPPRATNDEPREKGVFYNMVLEALKEKEKRTLAKAAASQQPNLRCWLYAPLPSDSEAEEDDPHGKAPQK